MPDNCFEAIVIIWKLVYEYLMLEIYGLVALDLILGLGFFWEMEEYSCLGEKKKPLILWEKYKNY